MQLLDSNTITMLPLRGLAALASRCARRVQPIYREWNVSNGSEQHELALEVAISYAEEFAHGTRAPHELCGKGALLEAAADSAAKAASDTNAFEESNAAETAAMASRVALNAADSAQGIGPHERLRLAEAAAAVAFDTVQRMILSVAVDKRAAIREAAVADFNMLLRMTLGSFPHVGNIARLV